MLLVGAVILFSSLSVYLLGISQRPPYIVRIDPEVAAVDEPVVLEGRGFGRQARLTIDEVAVDPSRIISWSDTRIVFGIDRRVRSGIVRVVTSQGHSNARFLTVDDELPVVLGEAGPREVSLTPPQQVIGGGVVITGFGFGPRTGEATISFSGPRNFVVRGSDVYVLSWNDRRIELVLPGEADAGLYDVVVNGAGESATLTIAERDWKRVIGQPHRYALRFHAEVESGDEALQVIFPPLVTSRRQPSVQVIRESAPFRSISAGRALIASFPPVASSSPEQSPPAVIRRVERVVAVERSAVRWEVSSGVPRSLLDDTRAAGALRRRYVQPRVGRLDDSRLEAFLPTRTWRSPDILTVLRAIHGAVVDALSPAANGTTSVSVALEEGEGAQSHVYAVLAVALARRAGVPARRVEGVFYGDGGQTFPHAWVEFFVPRNGWIPADPALADQMYGDQSAGVRAFYGEEFEEATLGQLDNRRIALYREGEDPLSPYPHGMRVPAVLDGAPRFAQIVSSSPSSEEGVPYKLPLPVIFGVLE